MFGVDAKKFSDMEVAQAYWDSMKQRMEWCRKEAQEYLKNNGRRKFYKLTYDDDIAIHVTYSAISDDDVKKVREAIAEDVAENGPYKSKAEEEEFLSDILRDLDIDWVEDYLPSIYMCHAEPPIVTGLDLDDFIYCCAFKVMHTTWYRDNQEELINDGYNIKVTDDEYVDLVTAKLFDKNLSFYDLKFIYGDLYNRVANSCHFPHQHYVIFMTEINDIAKAILDSKTKEELPPSVEKSISTGVILNTIYKNEDKFDDPHLMRAIKLATYQDY